METNTKQLIARMQQGDKRAFQAVFEEYYVSLEYYAEKFVCNDEAKDVVHNVFQKLIERHKTIQIKDNLGGYLFQMVRNEALMVIRQRKETSLDDYPNELLVSEINYFEEHQSLLEKDIYFILMEAIDDLPPRIGEIFAKSKLDGMRNADIAIELDISVKTVEKHITKAYKLLRENLKDLIPYMIWCSTLGAKIFETLVY